MRKYLLMLLGSIIIFLCWAKPDFRYRYWFDSQDSEAVYGQTSDTDIHIDADVSSLSDCLHTLNLQIIDEDDTCSVVQTRLFVKMPIDESIGIKYWFDGHHESATYIPGGSLMQDIDVSSLSDGLHTVTVQPIGNIPSSTRSAIFIKVPQLINVDHLTCLTSIDGEVVSTDVICTKDGIIQYEIPLTGVSQGLHSLCVQAVTPSGAATPAVNCYFLRHLTGNEMGRLQCLYSIDGAPAMKSAGQFNSGDFHFDIDVQELTNDIHNITYMLMAENGSVSDIKTAFFIKTPQGGNGLVMYRYWLNNDEAEVNEVRLDSKAQKITITDLIPLASQPLRSSNFKFEIKQNGEPWIYARNDFHFRAFGVDGRNVESTKTYTDYAVSQKVEDVTELTGIGSISMSRPADNGICWFKINSEIGDSITLKANNACTIQMFSPSGQEIYSVRESEAVNIGGVHIYEDGDYYVAVHDVTSQNVRNLTLDYEHIDRYAVLSWTPDEIGVVDGTTHVSLLGNGYDKIKQAVLSHGTEILAANKINVTDKSHAELAFRLDENITLGDYDLVLTFEDEDESENLVVEKAINLTTAIFGNIDIKLTAHRSVAKPYPVQLTITNKGNVEYSFIPIELAWEDLGNLSKWNFLDFDLLTDEIGYASGIDPVYLTNNLYGKGNKGVILPMILKSLAPGQSIELTMGYIGEPHAMFEFHSRVFRPWNIPQDINWEIGNGGCGPAVDNPVASLDGYTMAEVFGTEENPEPTLDEIEELTEDMTTPVPDEYDRNNGWMSGLGDKELSQYSTKKILYVVSITTNPKPTSGPGSGTGSTSGAGDNDSGNEGGGDTPQNSPIIFNPTVYIDVNIYMPGDPNDMLGYLSPAESHYIKKGLKNVSYTIEFENDPELANSAAHQIRISNQIDGTKLDLSTFSPKVLKLGNKTKELDGSQNFVTTIDMRPEINSLAQVTLNFDSNTGLASWDIIALDPMTLDPTDDIMQGILPVNDSEGRGLGEIIYDISLNDNLEDGTSITNSASIIFDQEDAIDTPVWENILDYVDPVSKVVRAVKLDNGQTLLTLDATDTRSGVWKVDIYGHASGSETWMLIAEGVDISTTNEIVVDIDQAETLDFCSIAYDMAGNQEYKPFAIEATLSDYLRGDANNDGMVSIADYTVIINNIVGKPNSNLLFDAADVDQDGLLLIADATSITNIVLGNTATGALCKKAAPAQRYFNIDDVNFDSDGTGTATVNITNANRYTACQYDIELPEGMMLCDAALIGDNAASHNIKFAQIGQGKARVIVYSSSSANLSDNDVMTLTFKAGENLMDGQSILINEAYIVECTGQGVVQHLSAPASALEHNALSGIDNATADGLSIRSERLTIIITSDSDREVTITDISGQSTVYTVKTGVTRIDVAVPGAYIVNNHKLILF